MEGVTGGCGTVAALLEIFLFRHRNIAVRNRLHPAAVFLDLLAGQHQRTHQQIGAVAGGSAVPLALGDIVGERESHGNIGGVPEPVKAIFGGVIDKARHTAFRFVRGDLADGLPFVVIFHRQQSTQRIVSGIRTGCHITGDAQFLIKVHNRAGDDAVERPHTGQPPEHRIVVAVL